MPTADLTRPQLLSRFVACGILESGYSLEDLQALTGLHRSKLGRLRLEQDIVSEKDADLLFRSFGKHVLALFVLVCLGEDDVLGEEVKIHLRRYLDNPLSLSGRIDAIGFSLVSEWSQRRAKHLVRLVSTRRS